MRGAVFGAAAAPFSARPPTSPVRARASGWGLVFAALLLTVPLAGCGKKNSPVPPPGGANTYPLPYPRE